MPIMRNVAVLVACLLMMGQHACAQTETAPTPRAELIEVQKIWNAAPHCAFTDLVRWQDKFYCAFREGQQHADDRGVLRILVSTDGDHWTSAGVLSHAEYDLRDAALAELPDGRLMVLGGIQTHLDGVRRSGTFVSFTANGTEFTEPQVVVPLGRWLWRVTRRENELYGVAYGAPDQKDASSLLKSTDGVHYETVTRELLSGGYPTEARIRFAADGTAYCLHRRDGAADNTAKLGVSRAPYNQWTWHDLGRYLGGPNFLQVPSGHWIAAGRLLDGGAHTELLALDVKQGTMKPILRLPSGGDTSYPGMVWHDGLLWVSYYSSHETGTSIYLARIKLADEAPSSVNSDALELGTHAELFVDHHWIDRSEGTTLQLHAPHDAGQVLAFDKPWEGAFSGYVTVLSDGDRLRMYYRGLPKAGRDGTDNERTCYAESDDGIHWTKPVLGIFDVEGSTENNVVLSGQTPASHNFCPFRDANPNALADAKYKALGGTSRGLIAFASADGVHWNRLQQEPVITAGQFDSQNVSFWSSAEQHYVCYFRTWTETNYGGFRTVSRATSTDFVTWSDPEPMTFGDRPYEHLYTNQTQPYYRSPNLLVGVAARFMPGRQVITAEEAAAIQVDAKYYGDISDAVLLTSRGGTRYDRAFMESFIRPGPGIENWVSRTNYPACGIVPTGEGEMSVYVQKNYGQPTAHLRRFTLREDGFVSLHAGYDGGEMIAKPLRWEASGDSVELFLNMATSAAGSVRVAVCDATGEPFPGFALGDCQELIGDQIARRVRWKSGANLAKLNGRVVRFKFALKDADVYSFRVHEVRE
ncbi:MAG: hypothetical protein KDA60_01550 [Planctomycetales bacterium]|nr:hypothetical protein [Planctomycetales bacterium]